MTINKDLSKTNFYSVSVAIDMKSLCIEIIARYIHRNIKKEKKIFYT